jgi:hypothetical protein
MLGPAKFKAISMSGFVAWVTKRQAIVDLIPKVWVITPSLYVVGV